ncbi:ESCRT-III subunit protein VPS24 [Sporothrix schenckii 1099-18]|nr:ESCRT-III subunit protein VPS24 [Sporothrix schenckii 1099-18]KJR87030.1 hypothetical protein SPSK_01688 [Sporothrix schenckii 1099-18]
MLCANWYSVGRFSHIAISTCAPSKAEAALPEAAQIVPRGKNVTKQGQAPIPVIPTSSEPTTATITTAITTAITDFALSPDTNERCYISLLRSSSASSRATPNKWDPCQSPNSTPKEFPTTSFPPIARKVSRTKGTLYPLYDSRFLTQFALVVIRSTSEEEAGTSNHEEVNRERQRRRGQELPEHYQGACCWWRTLQVQLATMDNIRALFQKPDPQAQLRKCNTLLRSNMRKIDRDIANAKRAEITTKNLIIQADRRAQRDPSRAKQAQREVRDFARELVRARRTSARLVTGRAQLNSVQMQVSEAFAMRKIEGSIRASVGVMRDVNQLIRLPELAGTMQELSVELMKAGIVEEMVNETLPEDDAALFEDEDVAEADSEVDRVLSEILKDRMAATGPVLPSTPVGTTPVPAAAAEPAVPVARNKVAIAEGGPNGDEDEEDEEDTEAMMAQMRNRLESLRS